MAAPPVDVAAFADLDPATLHDILRLRAQVFVVEQACVFEEIDGRDVEPDARHRWIQIDGKIVACARTLRDADRSTRIGRIVTHPDHRGQGLASRLIDEAMRIEPGPYVMWVQAHLTDWYAAFGFEVVGPSAVEAGIEHVTMRSLADMPVRAVRPA
jgi:ElaA protein